MTHATRIGRFVGFAVGSGIGAALAAMPGIAWADDFQISFDGMDLFPAEGNTATATTVAGEFGLAIAMGDGADAVAVGGAGDYALADGDGSTADVGGFGTSNYSTAIADGDGANASAGVGSFDYASATGDDTVAAAGYGNFDSATAIDTGSGGGALAGGGSLLSENNDTSFAWGPHSLASAGDTFGNYPSSNDIAAVFDPFGTAGSSAFATDGNFDFAAAFGDMLHAMTPIGNYLVDILPSL
jgi:hypothetical protein